MLCYRDMTFCPAKECKQFHKCPRAFNSLVKSEAERWWGSPNAPVALFNEPKKLNCYEPPEEIKPPKNIKIGGKYLCDNCGAYHAAGQCDLFRTTKKKNETDTTNEIDSETD